MIPYIIVGALVFALLTALYLRKYDTPNKLRGSLEVLKDASVEYPGHMAFANKGGEYFHGCRVAHFRNIKHLNEFFLPGNAGHLKLVAEIIPQTDGSILAVYTNKLSAEDMEDIEEWNRNQNEYFSQKREQRRQQKQEAEEAKLKEAAEQKRLAEVGRKYEARVSKIRGMPPGLERKREEKALNSGDLLTESNSVSGSEANAEAPKPD